MKKKKEKEHTPDHVIWQHYVEYDIMRWDDEGPVPLKNEEDKASKANLVEAPR